MGNLWDAAVVAATAAGYAATLGAAGGVFFLKINHALIAPPVCRTIRRLVGTLSVIAVLAGGMRISALAGSMSGELAGMFDASLARMILQSGEGRTAFMRVAGLLLVTPAVLKGGSRPAAPAVIGALIAATSFAWGGHAHAAAPSVPAILLVSVHLLAAAFWIGALAPLLLISSHGDLPQVALTAARFGAAAVFVVGALVAAGLGLLWILLGSLSGLWASTYGRCVSIKLGLVALLLCFAAFNKLRLTPRLLAEDERAAKSLRRSIGFEMLLVGLILVVTATFTTLSGPPSR
jgi:putative copper resistance protein D